MTTVSRAPGYPNILLVSGIDPTTEYRPALQEAIFAATPEESPVREGTHDFWFGFPYPAQPAYNPNPPNFGYSDNSITPVPLRGIVDMRAIPADIAAGTIAGALFTCIHEGAHYWLVPADMTFQAGTASIAPMTGEEITTAINADQPLSRPALLGRQDSHWSTYFQADESPMDGVGWDRQPDAGGLARWTQRDAAPYQVSPAGQLPIPIIERYCDFELALMGLKSLPDAYPMTGGDFYWLTPRLSIGPPMSYHTGVLVAFSPDDIAYLGFYSDHGQLKVERSTGWRGDPVDIGPAYSPLTNESMMLRVVRRGDTYLFQACIGNSVASVLSGHGPFMFDDLDSPVPASGSFEQWQTVASFSEPAPPQAIGLITKTWNAILCEGQFFSFELNQDGVNTAFPVWQVPEPLPAGAPYTSLIEGRVARDVPQAGASIRRKAETLILGVPYSTSFDHWTSVNNAPKILTKAPDGDFAFGATASVYRSMVSPGAAGAAEGMTMWGTEGSESMRNLVVPARISTMWQPAPATYRCAMIVVAQDGTAVGPADLGRLDVLRQYFENAMSGASSGLMTFDTTL